MKIVKRGAVPRNEFKGECRNCKSVVEYDRDELKVEGSRDGDFAHVKCPVCEADFCVYPKQD